MARFQRQTLYQAQQPGGPQLIGDPLANPGNVFYVHSGTGTDSAGYGATPDAPLATLDYAIGLCDASKCDRIALMPGHAESKTASGDLATVDVAGVEIVGLGRGGLIPTFTLGHASATITVSAANVTIRGVKIIADAADVAVGLTCANTADGLVVEDCWLTDGGLTKELVIGIQVAAACDNVTIQRNRFYTTVSAETGGCASAIKFVGESVSSRVFDNIALGHYTVACVDASTAASTGICLRGNAMCNIDTDAGLSYKGHASSINVLFNNFWAGTKNNTEPVSAVNASYCGQNFGIDAAAAGAILSPAAGAFA